MKWLRDFLMAEWPDILLSLALAVILFAWLTGRIE